MARTPVLVYAEHIEFVCIVMAGDKPDSTIPPRAYTRADLGNAIMAEYQRKPVVDLMLYQVHTDEDGDIWVRVANPQT